MPNTSYCNLNYPTPAISIVFLCTTVRTRLRPTPTAKRIKERETEEMSSVAPGNKERAKKLTHTITRL